MEWRPVSEKRWQGTEKNAELVSSRKKKITKFLLWQITLDNKFPNNFCICDEYVINLFVYIYEVRKET
jgi:hypothetical protein